MNKEYQKIVENYFRDSAFDMIAPSMGSMNHPFVDPGPQYRGQLWDWDSYFSVRALIDICEYFKDDPTFDYETRSRAVGEAAKGCVKIFLDTQLEDGFIPIMINSKQLESGKWAENHRTINNENQHKPFLCQSALQASKYTNDFEWFDIEKLIKHVEYYRKNQFHERSGLYIFKSDYMIGVDNNPSVYGFPYSVTGDIYLNSFMYAELCALAELLKLRGDARFAEYETEAERLKKTVQEECFDQRDGIYYSVFVDITNKRTEGWHKGLDIFWKSLPMRIRFAMCFVPMYVGIATDEQTKIMIDRHLLDPKFNSPHGLRSLPTDEKMYTLAATQDPSNSNGPIWLIYNYIAFFGLLRMGHREHAEHLCSQMVENFALDIIHNGKTDECYHPETGEPIMKKSFLSWNSLIVSMMNALK